MNTNMYYESKQELRKELGKEYPTCRRELSPSILLSLANYIPSPNEDEYKDYREYDKAKYDSAQWAFISKMSKAMAALKEDGETGKAAWEEFLDWVVENYFPEFASEEK